MMSNTNKVEDAAMVLDGEAGDSRQTFVDRGVAAIAATRAKGSRWVSAPSYTSAATGGSQAGGGNKTRRVERSVDLKGGAMVSLVPERRAPQTEEQRQRRRISPWGR